MTPGYSMRSFPHSARGGGLAFIVKDTIFDPANVAASFLFSHVSIGLAQLTFTSQRLVYICVYKPPPSEKTNWIWLHLGVAWSSRTLQSPWGFGVYCHWRLNFTLVVPPTLTSRISWTCYGLICFSQAISVPTHCCRPTLHLVVCWEKDFILHSVSSGHSLLIICLWCAPRTWWYPSDVVSVTTLVASHDCGSHWTCPNMILLKF